MAEIFLTQREADSLLAMEKHSVGDRKFTFSSLGQKEEIELVSFDKREKFLLDLSTGRSEIRRVKLQNRARKLLYLLDLIFQGDTTRIQMVKKSAHLICTYIERDSETNGRYPYHLTSFQTSMMYGLHYKISCGSAISPSLQISDGTYSHD